MVFSHGTANSPSTHGLYISRPSSRASTVSLDGLRAVGPSRRFSPLAAGYLWLSLLRIMRGMTCTVGDRPLAKPTEATSAVCKMPLKSAAPTSATHELTTTE